MLTEALKARIRNNMQKVHIEPVEMCYTEPVEVYAIHENSFPELKEILTRNRHLDKLNTTPCQHKAATCKKKLFNTNNFPFFFAHTVIYAKWVQEIAVHP